MAFSSVKFLGSTVRSVSASQSWNTAAAGRLHVSLADDPTDGDSFVGLDSELVNTPCFFELGGFTYWGLLQNPRKSLSTDGFPVYEVDLVDPKDILEGAKVILSGYYGTVGGVRNLLNVFGYYESRSFGLSSSNDSGMPWHKLLAGITALVNSGSQGDYGGPLTFHGVGYTLDLSQLPALPAYYRLANHSMSLLEIIAQICEDGACDFFLELRNRQIRVRTASRLTQPALGTIQALVDDVFGGNVIRSEVGLEGRNETTSAFLVGGEKTFNHYGQTVVSFWGYDVSAQPIFGDTGYYFWTPDHDTKPEAGDPPTPKLAKTKPPRENNWQFKQVGTETYEQFVLNSSPISDLTGGTRYLCSDLELRFALHNMGSWLVYMQQARPELAAFAGLSSPLLNGGGPQPANDRKDLLDDRRANVEKIQTDLDTKQNRFYQFVLSYARDYYGKRFAVPLPFVLSKVDPETLQLTTSSEIADAGWSSSPPFSLSELNADIFTLPDGRFKPIAYWSSLTGVDLSQVTPQGTLTENEKFFSECQVEAKILFTPTPYAVVSLPSVVWEKRAEGQANYEVLAGAMKTTEEKFTALVKRGGAAGNVGFKLSPAARPPNEVSVPLKSNLEVYGPYYIQGAYGKVLYEQDSSLTPWNYGGQANMDAAGAARVTTVATNQTVAEAGSIEVAGLPQYKLGDVLSSGGPHLTNLDIRYGVDGVTTTYRFASFTQRFGVTPRQYPERLRRLAATQTALRRDMRARVRKLSVSQAAVGKGAQAAQFAKWQEHLPKEWKKESPYDCFVAQARKSDWTSDSWDYRTKVNVSAVDSAELIACMRPDSDQDHQMLAFMSMEGLLRPFATSTSPVAAAASGMPHYGAVSLSGVSRLELDPYKTHNDIAILAFGNSYEGFKTRVSYPSADAIRSLALRGPLLVAGWGHDVEGSKIPDGWPADYLNRQEDWKVGPVDDLWDGRRGVWTSHGSLRGRAQGAIPAAAGSSPGSGQVDVFQSTDGGVAANGFWSLTAYNWTDREIPTSSNVLCHYSAYDNKWVAHSLSRNDILPTGAAYRLLYMDPSSNTPVWSETPTINYLQVGRSGYIDGTLFFCHASGHKLRVGAGPMDRTIVWEWPTTMPGTGDVLTASWIGGANQVNLSWSGFPSASSSSGNLPGGCTPYTLLGGGSTGTPDWFEQAEAVGLSLVGTFSPGAASGKFPDGAVGPLRFNGHAATPGNMESTLLYGPLHRGGEISIILPSGDPSAVTATSSAERNWNLGVLGWASGVAQLGWTHAAPTGATESVWFYNTVRCSGSTLVVGSGQLHFVHGVYQGQT